MATCRDHDLPHAFASFHPLLAEGMPVLSRRNMVKAGIAGLAGLSVPQLLAAKEDARSQGKPSAERSIILLWMTGGPSQIDTFDPKPDRPWINRGPFDTIDTAVPGVRICEHLPKMAARLDRFSLIRSVDCKGSNHEPNMVMQTGHRAAAPRINREGHLYPAFGSIIARHRGGNADLPAYVAFNKSRSHLAFAGWLGQQYDPFPGNSVARLPVYDLVGNDTGQVSGSNIFALPAGLQQADLYERERLRTRLDLLQRTLDRSGAMDTLDTYQQQAVDMVSGGKARAAFDLTAEPAEVRARYGNHLWCQQALLARRLVEAGVAFVTLDLSYHTASGTWDTHGDNIPPYGGISKGLKPLLPLFDHLITTLVDDLAERGLLERTLVLAMGEFGRTPVMGTQDSTDGRNHWPEVMSMALAGGGLRHGQVIGASTADGGHIKDRPVTPGDLAATIFRYMGVPLDGSFDDFTGRPRPIVDENGQPIHELFG